MLKATTTSLMLLCAGLVLPTAAHSMTITSEPGNNLADFSYVIDAGNQTIDIYETWGPATASQVLLRFDDWDFGYDAWTVTKHVTNLTGDRWDRFSHELLQADRSSSHDLDGLSFAQYGLPYVPRSSDRFPVVLADETDDRDYLLYSGGLVNSGQEVLFTFGITTRRENGDTVPFYLRQAEFLARRDGVVPEPATWAMLIAGFGLVGASLRRRRGAVPA